MSAEAQRNGVGTRTFSPWAVSAGDLLAAATRRLLSDACDGVVVAVADHDRRRLTPLVVDHVEPERAALAAELLSEEWPAEGLLADVLANGESRRLQHAAGAEAADGALRPGSGELFADAALVGLIVAPIVDTDGVIGTLGVWRDRTAQLYTQRDQAKIEHYGRMIAPAMRDIARDHVGGLRSQGPSPASDGGAPAALERLFDVSTAMFALASADGSFTRVNPAWERVLGWTVDELTGRPYLDFVHDEDVEPTLRQASRVGEPGAEIVNFENRYRSREGDYRWLSWSATTDGVTWFAVATDVTNRKLAERVEAERVREAWLLAGIVESSDDAIVAKDLDGTVTAWNPAAERRYGYAADEAIGCNIRDLIIPTDLRGDEADIVERVTSEGKVSNYETRRVCKDGSVVHVSVSGSPLRDSGGRLVGVATIARDISARKAEEAEAERTLADLSWVGQIRDALDAGQFVLASQPIVDLATGEAAQAELLIRMRGSDGELIEPAQFLPVAERYGLIQEIDRWVVSQSVRMAAAGHKVEVNLSAASITQPALLTWVETELERSGADPANMVFEVTETALMQDIGAGTRFARRLTELGCSFALDDFGTGYGSFTYLKQLPVHYLKIDIEFVRDLLRDDANQHVVKAVVNLAQGFGLKTVAEGVEDAQTLDLLREYGVDFAQGFHLGRPQELQLEGA